MKKVKKVTDQAISTVVIRYFQHYVCYTNCTFGLTLGNLCFCFCICMCTMMVVKYSSLTHSHFVSVSVCVVKGNTITTYQHTNKQQSAH